MAESFDKRLKALRNKAGLSQEELAKALDVSVMSVCRWEWGERIPRANDLNRLAQALNVTIDELLNGPRKNAIEVTLRYEAELNGGLIDMINGNGYALTVADNGMVGITGAAVLRTKADLETALSKIKAMLEEGFARQVSKGLATE